MEKWELYRENAVTDFVGNGNYISGKNDIESFYPVHKLLS